MYFLRGGSDKIANSVLFRFDLKTGEGGLWCRDEMAFANGMAMAPDGQGLFVVESNAACVSYVPIRADGAAGTKKVVVEGVHNVPDGLAFAPDGSLFVSCRAASIAGGVIAVSNF